MTDKFSTVADTRICPAAMQPSSRQSSIDNCACLSGLRAIGEHESVMERDRKCQSLEKILLFEHSFAGYFVGVHDGQFGTLDL